MKKTFLTLIAALMVCVAFAQEQGVKPVVSKTAEQPKEIIQFSQLINIDTGYAYIRASDSPTSEVEILVRIEYVNSHISMQKIKMERGLSEVEIFPKFGNIDWVEIISISPDEDAYFYYRF